MSCLVTGVAGFIGSHLAEKLVEKGHQVVGIDSFTDYYPRAVKTSNLSGLRKKGDFTLVEEDVNSADLTKLLKSVELVFHLAAQPGVRPSWGASFNRYVEDNILATQRLLEACRKTKIKKIVYASSSSVYGDSERLPTSEDAPPRPVSPYGATKLTAEHLCRLYLRNFGVPAVILRYFTVYGPRQRPDMAFHRFISSISRGKTLEVYGDGSQSRDFTYVGDTVDATVLAAEAKVGATYNVGSGRTFPLSGAISLLETIIGKKAQVSYRQKEAGDVEKTSADVSRIERELGYRPRVSFEDGLRRQVAWQLAKESE